MYRWEIEQKVRAAHEHNEGDLSLSEVLEFVDTAYSEGYSEGQSDAWREANYY